MMRTKSAAMAAICCCAWLSGCGQDAGPTPTGAIPRLKAPTESRKGPSAEELTAGMATAPTMGKAPSTADLKFELGERPTVGQVLEINLALVPKFDGGPATVQVSSAQGLDAAQGEAPFEVAEVTAGDVYRHTLHMTPTVEGVLLVSLTVALKHDEISDSQVFSVPVIVEH